ncbi:MAG: hypothetical protein HZB79_07620 [Deltaproteobacteria bacterium]|nr:hypothetical protein [Deltaproteobacteria bacterium]
MNKRLILQISFIISFILSVFLTYYFVRLGIVGIIASVYIIIEARYGITKKIPVFWKKLKYWQKGAIIFIIIHTVLYILVLEAYEDASRKRGVEFGPLLAFIELPLLFLGFFGPQMSKLQYYTIFLWGSISYAFIGSLFGMIIDWIIYFSKPVLKKEGTNV